MGCNKHIYGGTMDSIRQGLIDAYNSVSSSIKEIKRNISNLQSKANSVAKSNLPRSEEYEMQPPAEMNTHKATTESTSNRGAPNALKAVKSAFSKVLPNSLKSLNWANDITNKYQLENAENKEHMQKLPINQQKAIANFFKDTVEMVAHKQDPLGAFHNTVDHYVNHFEDVNPFEKKSQEPGKEKKTNKEFVRDYFNNAIDAKKNELLSACDEEIRNQERLLEKMEQVGERHFSQEDILFSSIEQGQQITKKIDSLKQKKVEIENAYEKQKKDPEAFKLFCEVFKDEANRILSLASGDWLLQRNNKS